VSQSLTPEQNNNNRLLSPPFFFSLKSKAQRCLTCIECNSKFYSKNVNSLNTVHQNIRGLRNKTDELIHSFETDCINPHVLCLSELHMVEQDSLHLTLDGYLMGSSFYRQNLQKRGVCTFVKEEQCFNKICISHHCIRIWKYVQFNWKLKHVTYLAILSLYKASSGDLISF
jgi:exonuclease III